MNKNWAPQRFKYNEQKKINASKVVNGDDYHPLKLITVKTTSAIKTSTVKKTQKTTQNNPKKVEATEFVDPLSALSSAPAASDPLSTLTDPLSSTNATSFDPLSNPLSNPLSESYVKKRSSSAIKNTLERRATLNSDLEDDQNDSNKNNQESDEQWTNYKMKILNQFTTNERMSLTMTSIAKGDTVKEAGRNYQASVSDKMKTRLGQLDDFEEGGFQEFKNLTQQEFINRIQELKQMLKEAWQTGQKVKALKITIQCAKLLNDTSVMQFYPSKFVIIADVLDSFGSLVFNRIMSKCDTMSKDGAIEQSKITAGAREICVNWLLKIASIRELLPRLCIEAATIRCNAFIKSEPNDLNCTLLRLTNMVRGVGNPLVGVYIRAYLCRVGTQHMQEFKGHLKYNFYDYLATFQQFKRESVRNMMASQKISLDTYLSYHKPAIDWILSCLADGAHEETLNEVMEKCKKSEHSLLLINCCLSSFNSDYVASRAQQICHLITSYEETVLHKLLALEALGKSAVKGKVPESQRLSLMNDVWKVLAKVRNPQHFLACATPWMEFAAKYFSKREVNTVLGEVIKHVTPDRSFERLYGELVVALEKVLAHVQSVPQVLYMEKFLPYIDLFQNEEKKAEVCAKIAKFFNSKQQEQTMDPILVNVVLYIGRSMHDSLNALSIDDLRKSYSDLICSSISKINYGKDFEQQLAFYVQCRACFCNLDRVLVHLVHCVNMLSTKVTKIVRGSHTKKTSAFVRACTAFTFITIPSLECNLNKMNLYVEAGQVALNSQCVSQADAMFETAINLIRKPEELKMFTDLRQPSFWQNFTASVTNLLSSLLLVPDNTSEKGVLHLLRELLNGVVECGEVMPGNTKCTLLIRVLALLTAYSQDVYLHHIRKVDSNEILYGNDPKFLNQISQISKGVIEEIYKFINPKNQSEKQSSHARASCTLHMLDTLLAHSDTSDENMVDLFLTTWKMACENTACDVKYLKRIRNHASTHDSLQNVVGQLQLNSRV